jgi:hypothetical protein
MRSKCGLLSVCVVSAVLAIGTASASASVTPQTIRVLEVDTGFAGTGGYNATSNAAPSAGQGITFSAILYKWAGSRKGAPVGHLQVVCTATLGPNALCNAVASLPSGSIEFLGTAPLSSGSSVKAIAVVGGTGSYVGAQGYLSTKAVGNSNGNTSADTIHITG